MGNRNKTVWGLGMLGVVLVAIGVVWATRAQGTAQENFVKATEYSDGGDCKNAARHYRRTSDRGHAEAWFALAKMCLEGLGTKPYHPMAVQLFTQAATQGHSEAQYTLGLLYEEGRGVERDIDVAYYWYGRAAQQGHQEALKLLQRNL